MDKCVSAQQHMGERGRNGAEDMLKGMKVKQDHECEDGLHPDPPLVFKDLQPSY